VLPLWGRVAAAAALVGAGVGIGVLVSRPPPGNQIGPLGPPPCSPQNRSGAPAVCVSQPWGDGETGYVLHGVGFSADARVSVSVAESHAAPGQLTTDASGTFNYTLDQEHHFFAGPLPVGTYHCTASEPGQHGATATFRVYPAGHVPAQPPPPPPPGGGQGQGQPPPQ
jgi:hypothetical protein